MKPRSKSFDTWVACIILCSALGCASAWPKARTPRLPEDQPFSCDPGETARLTELIRPYVEYARLTYPDARMRYLRGLPRGHVFFLTTLFHHSPKRVEQVFVEVSAINGQVISGLIASEPMGPGFTQWQPYEFPETEILDWTIQHPDGTEEGNVVGNFLDRYQGKCPQ